MIAATAAETLLRVPPFPGAKPVALVRPAPSLRPVEPGAAAALIEAMRRERVGGAFWTGADPWIASPTDFAPADPLALIAALAGRPVRCEGDFAALSGLSPGSAEHQLALADLVSRYLLAPVTWHDPFTGAETAPLAIVAILGRWRRLIEGNRAIAAAFGFAGWKQDTVAALLWAGEDSAPFASASTARLAQIPADRDVALWKARVPAPFLAALEASGRTIWEVEDGFIRSIGLGADCVPPLSIVVDDLGAHYDPSRPCRLEHLLAGDDPDADKLARARALREFITASGISKYGASKYGASAKGSGTALPRPAGSRRHILVVGQVEDDRSVLLGGCGLASNHELLRRVRTRCPDDYIIYRPHPDVEAGHRTGHVPPAEALKLADAVDPGNAISALIAMVDEVHVLTSLAGFEALLQGKVVVTHGVPFYAGWGLTTDLGPVPDRRHRNRDIDQLVAAVLIDYPRYLDPVTGLPCEAELLLARMGDGIRRENTALVALRKGWGRFNRFIARVRKTT